MNFNTEITRHLLASTTKNPLFAQLASAQMQIKRSGEDSRVHPFMLYEILILEPAVVASNAKRDHPQLSL